MSVVVLKLAGIIPRLVLSKRKLRKFPETYSDKEIGSAANKLRQLSALTGAKLTLADEHDDIDAALMGWLERISSSEGVALPDRYKTIRNFYWMFERWWIWLLILLLPLEVLIRRWHVLFRGTTA